MEWRSASLQRNTLKRFLVSLVVLGLILLAGAPTVKGEALCEKHGNGTVTCNQLVERIKSKWTNVSCPIQEWKLMLKLVAGQNSTNPQCLKMSYNVMCSTAWDKLHRKVRKEVCLLVDAGLVHNVTPHIDQYNRSMTGILNIPSDRSSSITWKSDISKAAYVAVTSLRPSGGNVEASLVSNPKLNNDYFMSPNISILVISLMNEIGNSVEEPVVFNIGTKNDRTIRNLPTSQHFTNIEWRCMFYDITASRWTDRSCKTNVTAYSTSCLCDHNSAFAVVFCARNVTLPQEISTASTVLEVTSIIFLALTAVLLGVYRKRMRNFDRVLVQINLCVAMLLMHLFFVVSPYAVKFHGLCHTLAIATHYFLVATAVLMVMEGTLMLTKVLFPHFFSETTSTKRRRIVGFLLSWIVPLIYAVICGAAGTSRGGYIPKTDNRPWFESCWISHEYRKYVVVIPCCLALFINICIAIRLGVLVWRMSKSAEDFKPSNLRDQNKASHAGKALRAIMILLPILGIPWILGLLVNVEPLEVAFASMHVIVNGLQGVLLFAHYALFNEDMRGALKRTWTSSVSALPTVHFVSNSTNSSSIPKTSKERSDSVAGLRD